MGYHKFDINKIQSYKFSGVMLNSNLRISNLIFKDTPDNRLYSSFISASLDEIKEYTRNYGELNLYNVHMTLVDNNKLKLEIIRTNEPNQIEITLDRGSIHPLQKQYGEAGLRLSEIIYRKAVLTVDNWGDGDSILCLPVYKAIFDIIDTETSENTGRKLEMSSGELLANIVNMSKYTSVEHNRHTEDKFKYLSGFWQFGIHKQVPVYEVHKSAKSLGKNVINGEPGSTMFNVKYTRDEENERAINKWINTIDNKLAVMGSGGTIRGNTSILTELSLDSKADGIKLPNFISIQSNSLSLSSLHKINLSPDTIVASYDLTDTREYDYYRNINSVPVKLIGSNPVLDKYIQADNKDMTPDERDIICRYLSVIMDDSDNYVYGSSYLTEQTIII